MKNNKLLKALQIAEVNLKEMYYLLEVQTYGYTICESIDAYFWKKHSQDNYHFSVPARLIELKEMFTEMAEDEEIIGSLDELDKVFITRSLTAINKAI